GALIVDEPTPPAVDRDVLLLFEDWPTADGLVTINGAPAFKLSVRPNERLRLRVIHASLARTLTLRFERHAAMVMAIDVQPAEPFLARDGRVMLGAGNRLDLFVDMTLGAGESAALLLADAGSERPIVRFLYAGKPERAAPLAEPAPLGPNPLPARLDLRNASRHEL